MLTFIIIILFQLIVGRASQELQEKLAHLEERFQSWLPTFKAADPTMQKYCMDILTTRSGSSSQFAQDVFIYWNIFKYWPMNGRKGFYVDFVQMKPNFYLIPISLINVLVGAGSV